MKLGEKIRYLRSMEGAIRGLSREMTQAEVARAMSKELKKNVSITTIFECPTIKLLAAKLDGSAPAGDGASGAGGAAVSLSVADGVICAGADGSPAGSSTGSGGCRSSTACRSLSSSEMNAGRVVR